MPIKINILSFVKLFALMLAFLLVFSCSDNNTNPSLKFSKVSIIQIPAAGEMIPAPRSLATTKDDKLIVLDDVGRVLVFDKKGKLLKKWWMPEFKLGRPEGVCELRDGRIAVTNTHYSKVVIFKADGSIDLTFSKKGIKNGELSNPVGISEDPEGNLYVCEYGFNDRVQQFTNDGKFIRVIGKSGIGPGEFQRPSGVTLNNNILYVVDAVNNRIQLFEENGKFLKSLTVSPAFYLPYDLKFDKDNFIYIAEYGNACVTKLNPDGTLAGRFYPEDPLRTPWGIAVNTEGTIYVADTGNRRIVVLTP